MSEYKGKCCSEEEWLELYHAMNAIVSGASVNKLPFSSSFLDEFKTGLCDSGMRPKCQILNTLIDAISFQLTRLEHQWAVKGAAAKDTTISANANTPSRGLSSRGKGPTLLDDTLATANREPPKEDKLLLSGSDTTDDEAGIFSDGSRFKRQFPTSQQSQSPNSWTIKNRHYGGEQHIIDLTSSPLGCEDLDNTCFIEVPVETRRSPLTQNKSSVRVTDNVECNTSAEKTTQSSAFTGVRQKKQVWFDHGFQTNVTTTRSTSIPKRPNRKFTSASNRGREDPSYLQSSSDDGTSFPNRRALKRTNNQPTQYLTVQNTEDPANPPVSILHQYPKVNPSENISAAIRKMKSGKINVTDRSTDKHGINKKVPMPE